MRNDRGQSASGRQAAWGPESTSREGRQQQQGPSLGRSALYESSGVSKSRTQYSQQRSQHKRDDTAMESCLGGSSGAAREHNRGYSAEQARLAHSATAICETLDRHVAAFAEATLRADKNLTAREEESRPAQLGLELEVEAVQEAQQGSHVIEAAYTKAKEAAEGPKGADRSSQAVSALLGKALELNATLAHEEATAKALGHAAAHHQAHAESQAMLGDPRGFMTASRAACIAESDREREAIVRGLKELSGRFRLEIELLLRRETRRRSQLHTVFEGRGWPQTPAAVAREAVQAPRERRLQVLEQGYKSFSEEWARLQGKLLDTQKRLLMIEQAARQAATGSAVQSAMRDEASQLRGEVYDVEVQLGTLEEGGDAVLTALEAMTGMRPPHPEIEFTRALGEKEESDLAARLDRLARQQVAVEQGYADVEREWRQSRGLDTSGSAS